EIFDEQLHPIIGDGSLLLNQFMKNFFPLFEKTKHENLDCAAKYIISDGLVIIPPPEIQVCGIGTQT
ncbi:MAG TPA: hypothetical protein VK880_12305, partial [Anaerolineales bacterium]|nr:hypothetical protein [Anaerolineales bacterium]